MWATEVNSKCRRTWTLFTRRRNRNLLLRKLCFESNSAALLLWYGFQKKCKKSRKFQLTSCPKVILRKSKGNPKQIRACEVKISKFYPFDVCCLRSKVKWPTADETRLKYCDARPVVKRVRWVTRVADSLDTSQGSRGPQSKRLWAFAPLDDNIKRNWNMRANALVFHWSKQRLIRVYAAQMKQNRRQIFGCVCVFL